MTDPTLIFETAPPISDQAAHDIREFLYEFTSAFENHYYAQLKRYEQQCEEQWREGQDCSQTLQNQVIPFDEKLDF